MIIEESDEISKDAFLYTCEVDEELRESIEEYPHDYGFYRSRHRGVYFFTHSMIEHFYQ